jgi:hypothetical protein
MASRSARLELRRTWPGTLEATAGDPRGGRGDFAADGVDAAPAFSLFPPMGLSCNA